MQPKNAAKLHKLSYARVHISAKNVEKLTHLPYWLTDGVVY